MAKRHVQHVSRRLTWGLLLLAAVAFLYGYWAPFPYRSLVQQAARREHISPYLVAAVIRVESGYRPDAVSRRGAVGLMQLMPSTAQWIAVTTHQTPHPNLRDPKTNIALGTWYLTYLLRRYHNNETLALAAYNGGPETVDRWIETGVLSLDEQGASRIPYPETENFVRRVAQFRVVYGTMYAWLTISKHSTVGVVSLAKVMSEETKRKLGERLGVGNIVREEGWGGVPARQCGNLVREAIRLAEEELSRS